MDSFTKLFFFFGAHIPISAIGIITSRCDICETPVRRLPMAVTVVGLSLNTIPCLIWIPPCITTFMRQMTVSLREEQAQLIESNIGEDEEYDSKSDFMRQLMDRHDDLQSRVDDLESHVERLENENG